MTKLQRNDRIAFIGKTRSGKSFLVRKLLQGQNRVLFFDPKLENGDLIRQHKNAVIIHKISDLKKELYDFWGKPRQSFFIIFQPYKINKEIFNEFCKIAYNRGNLIIVLDETLQLTQGKLVDYHERIIRMGAYRKIGHWSCMQRPAWVDNYMLSENNHFFIFKVQLEEDRKKLRGIIGEIADQLKDIKEYHYVHYSTYGEARLCAPISA